MKRSEAETRIKELEKAAGVLIANAGNYRDAADDELVEVAAADYNALCDVIDGPDAGKEPDEKE